jgi:hypothetical protein
MWLVLNDAFLSIVEHDTDKSFLRVRARVEGDIERVFPGVPVQLMKVSDYAYHANVLRAVAGPRIAELVANIDYSNFKNSVKEHDRHAAYLTIWSAMSRLQQDRFWGTKRNDPMLEDKSFSVPTAWPRGWQPTPLIPIGVNGPEYIGDAIGEEPITDLPETHNPKRLTRHLRKTHHVDWQELSSYPTREEQETLHDDIHVEESLGPPDVLEDSRIADAEQASDPAKQEQSSDR